MTSDPRSDEGLIRRRDAGDGPEGLPDEAAATWAEWDRQDAALAALYGPVAVEPVPERHRRLITTAARRPPRSARLAVALPRLAAALALVALGATGGWLAAQRGGAGQPTLAAEALRAHDTFVVEVKHPVEVPASDEAHLVGWLSKRVGAPIHPPDLAAQGFALIGGRVLPEARGAAAQLMYEDATGRRLTLYVTREPGRDETAFRALGGGTTQGFWWIDGGLGCALIGDLPRDRLRALAVVAYDQLI